MTSNFDFLKKVDKEAFEIIKQAENLYQSEFFEPCITQTRRFGEAVCKSIFGNRTTTECTFDEMLATLKDKISSAQEKEFIDDLYFIKKQGNLSVHSVKTKSDGMLALECIQRAFEIALNYAVYYKKASNNLLNLQFDTEMLITGEKSIEQKSLKDKYKTLKKQQKISKQQNVTKKNKKEKSSLKSEPKKNNIFFKVILLISAIISISLLLTILILANL